LVSIVYAATGIAHLFFVKPKIFARVLERESGQPLAHARIKVTEVSTGFVVREMISDMYGRFYCLVSPGRYSVSISRRVGEEYLEIFRKEIKTRKGFIGNVFHV
jgi:hypothetical protein